MYAQENPRVHHLPPNTLEQDAELAQRFLLITTKNLGRPEALGILQTGASAERVLGQGNPSETAGVTFTRRLQAPYGQYAPIFAGQTHHVAVHQREGNDVEAFGPFFSQEDAYDYFPDHSSPHDTVVSVFEVCCSTAAGHNH